MTEPTDEERRLVARYVDAHHRSDAGEVIALLGDEIRFSMPPEEASFVGRAAVAEFFRGVFGPDSPGDWRLVETRANGRPAVACYLRRPGDDRFRAVTIDVLRIEGGALGEIVTFDADVLPAFGLSRCGRATAAELRPGGDEGPTAPASQPVAASARRGGRSR